ncbi:putative peroxidase [Mycena albidolilacea]|uniref:Peroxidase n=1 Tax=Mycena albidolilacea TaxID=1033008 RepID=A0AAD6Z9T5_9AGAR|nr:putative peroxidase [Mycena albidolilacea]
MKLSLAYLASIATVSASRTTCSKGRTAAIATCCVWYNVLDDLQANLFEGTCGDDAHDALRLSFHDAIGFSRKDQSKGAGADGSLIKFADIELDYAANEGLESIVMAERDLADAYGVSYGDIIQFAAAVSVRNCPGGPRISFMAGRPNATHAAADGLVPNPFDSANTILARIQDAGLTPEELVNLLASHSIAVQEHIDPTIPNTPFDLTPGIFDNNFYRDTLLPGFVTPGSSLHTGQVLSPFKGEFRLQSDFALSRDLRTAGRWILLSLDPFLMASSFATSMAKMALLGQNPGILHDCSEIIP